ncbi:hypothetical protein WMY93_033219, partial [Mugilogobius chulae]
VGRTGDLSSYTNVHTSVRSEVQELQESALSSGTLCPCEFLINSAHSGQSECKYGCLPPPRINK